MVMMTQNMEAYFRKVKRHLRGSSAYKQRILANMHSDAEEFLADHPGSTERELLQYLGHPREYAREFAATMPRSEQEKSSQLSRRILLAVVAFLLAALLIWACAVVSAAIEAKKTTNGYTAREIVSQNYMEEK